MISDNVLIDTSAFVRLLQEDDEHYEVVDLAVAKLVNAGFAISFTASFS